MRCTSIYSCSSRASTRPLRQARRFAEFERAMIQERVRAGLARPKSEGKRLGRPPSVAPELEKSIRASPAPSLIRWMRRCGCSPE
jgi:DNA invertase Pin-like site-specific DNA recombinase